MKTQCSQRAFTVLELMVLVVTLGVVAALLLPALARPHSGRRINCANDLKQIGLAFRVWEGDNGNVFPMRFYINSDGTAKFADVTNLFRYFQVMSNELNTPWVLICPQDDRKRATNFTAGFDNRNVSYFVGLDADEIQPNMFLAGDRNLTNGMPVRNGLSTLTTNQAVGWTMKIHQGCGNVGLADGSAQQYTSSQLKIAVANTGTNLNRLLFP